MPARTVLTAAQLLHHLSEGAASPSALARTLRVSRATVHRKLAELVTEGLVVHERHGPASTYRLKTAQEQWVGEPATDPARKIYMEMDPKTAQVVQEALEFYSRIGIGQFEELVHLARLGALTSSDIPLEALDAAQTLVSDLKHTLLGLPSHASYGIAADKVRPAFKTAWAVSRAVRHRLAWDRTPQGGLGVAFDEPLGVEALPDVTVTSSAGGRVPVDLMDLPAGLLLQHRAGTYRVLGPSADDSALCVYAESRSVQTALQMARNVAAGRPGRTFGL